VRSSRPDDALPIDDALDGLYTTLFTDQILY